MDRDTEKAVVPLASTAGYLRWDIQDGRWLLYRFEDLTVVGLSSSERHYVRRIY